MIEDYIMCIQIKPQTHGGGATSSDCVIRRVAGEMTLGKAKSEGPELKVLYVRILVSNIQMNQK